MSDSASTVDDFGVIPQSLGPLFNQPIYVPHYTFQSFGSGSCGNCSMLSYKGIGLLLDLGIGARQFSKCLKGECVDPSDLKGILVTHNHADHIRGVASFASRQGLFIYATEEVAHTFLNNRFIRQDLSGQVRKIEIGQPFQVGEMSVECFAVPHDAIDNVGYSISSDAGVFTIITDIGHITEDIEDAIRRSNYLVFESNYDEEMLRTGHYPMPLKQRITSGYGHISNRVSAETMVKLYHPELRFLALCHLSGDNNTPEIALTTMHDALTQHGVDLANDLKLFALKRGEVSPKYNLYKGY